ncbi:hypothetical protein ACLOJK_001877 [Asimina triloba]
MAEAAVNFFLRRLDSLFLEEGDTVSPLQDSIRQLEAELHAIRPLVGDVDAKKEEPDDATRSWAMELINTVHDADNCIDEFIVCMNCRDGSDPSSTIERFRTQLGGFEACLAELLQKRARMVTLENFKRSYQSLPYYLKSCLMYFCIFPEESWIARGRLARLLIAEGLVEEVQGENAEDTAAKYIEELQRMRMLQSADTTSEQGRTFKFHAHLRGYVLSLMEDQNFVAACASPDAHVPSTTRRLSIHRNGTDVLSNLNNRAIRSLLMCGVGRLSGSAWDCLKAAVCSLKLLRVLDLERVEIQTLPDEVGDLVHLRYLGLKHSDVSELPASLGNLRNLQTLDTRWCGRLTVLPDSILGLVRLRHLKLFKNNSLDEISIPKGIGKLNNIQTLTGVYGSVSIAEELSSMQQIRKLRVVRVAANHAAELYASIANLGQLESLKLEAGYGNPVYSTLPLEGLAPTARLRRLLLEGHLERVPGFLITLENLTTLRLGFSGLSENPYAVLQQLPNLKNLCFWQAYNATQMGREICRAGGFPKLEDFTICSHVLEEWTEIEEGAFPSLKYLRLHNCMRLRMLPEGLQHVTALLHLRVLPLDDDLEQRLRPDGGEENYKIKHIPTISFMTKSDVLKHLPEGSRLG